MAFIGMRKPRFFPISTPRVDGSAISYGTPVVIGPAVSAQVTFDSADNPDYGDDVVVNNDLGINGYNIALETTEMGKDARAAVLGWVAKSSGTPAAVTHYEVTDAEPPEGGFAFIRVSLPKNSSTRKYEAFFFHCLKFSDGGENASTKQKQITWNHPTINGSGIGVYIDATGKAKYFNWMEFDSEAAADSWINSQGGYTPPSP